MIDVHAYTIPIALPMLRSVRPPGDRVLSIYLDTMPSRLAEREHLLALRDRFKSIRAQLSPTELERFNRVAARAERFVIDELALAQPGLALFVGEVESYFFPVILPRRPTESVAWGERPLLIPLEELLDDCERIAVLLFDKEQARLYTVFLGEIEHQQMIIDEVPGKQATGGWFALAQSRYARHHEDHVRRHARRAIDALAKELDERPFDRLLLGGPVEAQVILRQLLPRRLRARLAGTLSLELFATDAEVLASALQAGAEIERREELRGVQALVESATSPNVALGLASTLEALSDLRVHQLYIATDFDAVGGECSGCGRLESGVGPCRFCGEPLRQVGDLRERIVDQAFKQGASVEIVSGEAVAVLAPYDGVGAWTRY